ncbi:MAG TPA: alpha/beta fold hydrolase [Terriglobales bacterium]|nr:alpha/beta fold hydrolase [Terriglobales bacterium]
MAKQSSPALVAFAPQGGGAVSPGTEAAPKEAGPKSVSFYSEGLKLVGDLYLPENIPAGEKRAGIVLCYGYTGSRKLYLPDTARALVAAGYVVLTFDYKGWGESEGSRTRLAPYSRVADAQAALTFLSIQPQVDPNRLGIYGSSYGGSTAIWTSAIDQRVKCTVAVIAVGNGLKWMRSVRRPDDFADLMERSAADRVKRVQTGKSELVERGEVLMADRKSAAISSAQRQSTGPGLVTKIPLEYIDDTAGFNPEWVVDKISPRPVLFITTDDDRIAPSEQSENMFARAGEPKKLVMLKGYGHYELYSGEAFKQMAGATLSWFRQYLPAHAENNNAH